MASDNEDTRAIMALVLGILGLVMCQVLGPVAWYLGAAVRREDQEAGREPNSIATVGMILGIVDTVMLLFQVVVGAIFCVIYGGFIALYAGMLAFLGVSGNM